MPDNPFMDFEIEGEIVPYVRMTQRSMWVNKRALAYRCSQSAIRDQIAIQMAQKQYEKIDKQPTLFVITVCTKRGHRFDLDNVVKAVIDAAQTVVISNDMWIDKISAECYRKADKEYCYLSVRKL